LAARLLEDNNEVVIIDNESTGLLSNISGVANDKRLTIHKQSILDEEFLDSVVSKTDYIFHLAAAVGVFNIVNKPIASMVTNIQGTENILKLALKYRLPVFLTSSSEVYGKNTSDSLKETDDRVIGSPSILRWSYSEAKAIDESLAYAYFVEHQLETRIVRFFNTVGPRQLGSYGMVVPRFIKSALEDEPISIYGDGSQTRCFAHVMDVVDAVMLVAFSPETVGKTINIGNNQEISMFDLAQKIISITNSKSKIVYLPYEEVYGRDFEDMARRVPNLDLIRSLVGWQPTRNLDTIILDIVQDLRSNSTKS
jgi:UDP-glucose 4-epimerase